MNNELDAKSQVLSQIQQAVDKKNKIKEKAAKMAKIREVMNDKLKDLKAEIENEID